jgi:sirohydrochlorin ferrochelatase
LIGNCSKPLAIIVAHGSPSDPEPVDLAVKALAAQAAAQVADGWRVKGATLARPGSLAEAFAEAEEGAMIAVYPLFMSNGWFVQTELRRRVAASTERPAVFLDPFGLDPALPELCIRIAAEAAGRQGDALADTTLVLAAHGSARNTAPAEAAWDIQKQIARHGLFRDVRLGFVEQEPSIAMAASGLNGQAGLCLPLFATTAGHVTGDVPRHLAAGRFAGSLLPPVGEDAAVAGLVAASITNASRKQALAL